MRKFFYRHGTQPSLIVNPTTHVFFTEVEVRENVEKGLYHPSSFQLYEAVPRRLETKTVTIQEII